MNKRSYSNLISTALALVLVIAVPAGFAAQAASTKKLDYSANGTTTSVAKGTSVNVRLGGSSWRIVKKSRLSSVVTVIGTAATGGQGGCTVMGNTCGTTDFKFKLKSAGKAYLLAERLTSGEAMRCVTDCTFKVTFKVK